MECYSKDVSILIGEDDLEDCFLIKDAFQAIGFEASFRYVGDGEQLIHYLYHNCARHPLSLPFPDLILLDLNMPLMDGRDVLRIIRSTPKSRDIPIVILTSSNRQEDREYCLKTGANAYMVKPPTFEGLVEVIRSIVTEWLMGRCIPAKDVAARSEVKR